MEDDFHRFHVVLEHDGEHVLDVRAEARRFPWTECPNAAEPLRALAGMPLSRRITAPAEQANPKVNCTHMFDVASLAITHAAAGRERRRYDITIPDRIDWRTRAKLHRDGELLLDWEVNRETIEQPPPFAGRQMRGSAFLRWAEETLDADTAEAAVALRRTCYIAMGRARNLDEAPDATVYFPLAKGSCHTFTPGLAERARRMKGTTLEFTNHPERLLADLGTLFTS